MCEVFTVGPEYMNSGPTCVALLVGVVAIYLSGLTVYLSAPNYLLEWPDGLKMFGNWMGASLSTLGGPAWRWPT